MRHTANPVPIPLVFALLGLILLYSFIQKLKVSEYNVGTIEGYNLSEPVSTFKLPKILEEISGLTDIDNNTIACVQDEEGIVFIYDLKKKEIINQFEFGEASDYEGITRVGNTLYILRSDGKLFEVDNFKNKDFQVEEYDLDIPVKNNEGLAFDAKNNRLLIAGKSAPKGKENKEKRVVFAFDLDTKKVNKKPAYEFSETLINQFVKENINVQKEKKNVPKIKFDPSGIAVHPTTGKLFVLSSKGKSILVFNRNGQVEAVHHLARKSFPQPEGITFLDNGDMFISNEGRGGQPTLLRFDYIKIL